MCVSIKGAHITFMCIVDQRFYWSLFNLYITTAFKKHDSHNSFNKYESTPVNVPNTSEYFLEHDMI